MTDKKEKQKNNRLYKTYGITLDDWKDMYKKQGGVCEICKTLPKSGVLCVDHIHKKGYKKMPPEEKKKYVRALVCFLCNTVFGRIERRQDPRKVLNNINIYFSKYKLKGEV